MSTDAKVPMRCGKGSDAIVAKVASEGREGVRVRLCERTGAWKGPKARQDVAEGPKRPLGRLRSGFECSGCRRRPSASKTPKIGVWKPKQREFSLKPHEWPKMPFLRAPKALHGLKCANIRKIPQKQPKFPAFALFCAVCKQKRLSGARCLVWCCGCSNCQIIFSAVTVLKKARFAIKKWVDLYKKTSGVMQYDKRRLPQKPPQTGQITEERVRGGFRLK